ncbi:histone-lysine N-methyltransferase, H3 lysine-9 specific SUVH5-like isoform X2 [Ricinus communis]|nr:histone-lysine N-methyltransferase, H3 lysine-9 specific SUVH5-like isoform X2 [Ricinus communis]
MENGHTDSHGSPPKYKRRRVSAIRDFPVGCGPSRIIAPMKMPSPGAPDTLSTPGDVVPKISCNGDIATPVENMVPRNYPPRRRVSAVRDFPPFCGRNAARIQENANVLASTENKNLILEKSRNEEELMRCMENTAVKPMGDNVQKGDADKHHLERHVSSFSEVQAESAGPSTKYTRNQDEFGASSGNELKVIQEGFLEQSSKSPEESIQHQYNLKSEVVLESGKGTIEGLENNDSLEIAFDRILVLGLMAPGNGPWSLGFKAHKPSDMAGSANESNRKRNDIMLQEQPKASVRTKENDTKNVGETDMKVNKKRMVKKKSSFPSPKAHEGIGTDVWDTEENLEHDMESNNFLLVRRSQNIDVTLPPSCPSNSIGKGDGNDASVTRNKVRETLRLFQVVYRKLVKEDEAKQKHIKRPDCVAASVLKSKGKYVNTNKMIGSVPGVEVGDEFQYRVELNIIGLHRPTQGGIDYMKEGGLILATSIVASGGYDDNMDDSDVLIYTGSGGNMMNGGDKEPEDQKLERGNLALKNSMDAKNPVRVIRGDTRASESSSARTRTYIYDGLYLVEKCWQDLGPYGKLVFKFRLVRIPGQPELAWKVVKKSKKFKVRDGLCEDDISKGKEKIPICAVNTIDDEKPPPFEYITHVIYPDWCRPIPPRGCNCTNGCSETAECSCVAKNGGEIPFNHNGAIVEAKPLVYECGPSCKCPPSCYNRVTQHGIKIHLEIFKTESRGWGVRSLNSIPSGSFICEYVGELLEEKEAEQRAGNDEYLFDIGNNSSDLWDGLSNLISETHSSSCEVVEESCFTIDAAKYGNVGRFVNHSCSPNLYAQNVLYDHEDKRVPHIMLFAAENIPPLQELTYHYNYTIDEVFDSDGNIKKKSCYCGSSECTGRMY